MNGVTLVRIEGNLQWKYLRAKTGEWVAVCDAMRLTVEANTFSELMEDINLTLDAVFRDLLTSHELDRFLNEHGWKAVGMIPQDPNNVKFDMPFFTAMMGSRDASEHLHQ